jgi:hypothetical protein
MAVLNIQPGTIVQFAHDTLFLSVVRLKNGQQVLGLTSRPTDWTIPFASTVHGLADSLKLLGPAPTSNHELQWVEGTDNLVHVMSFTGQNTFVINFVNGSLSACTLLAGSSPDSFFGIRPRDGKFVVQIVRTRPEATRFNILFPSSADRYSQDRARPVYGEREWLQARYPLA